MTKLIAQPLSQADFADFGEVVDLQGSPQYPKLMNINDGYTTRFHDLFTIDIDDEEPPKTNSAVRPVVSLFRTTPLPLPHRIHTMERHPRGSQAFLPMDKLPFLVLVAANVPTITVDDLVLFVTNGQQGINFYKNTWHHFQIGIGGERDFIVVDRGGADDNLEETEIQGEAWIPEKVF